MKITEVLSAEHAIFLSVFEQVELALPECATLAEVKRMAGIIEGLLRPHAATETDLAFTALDHALAEQGLLDRLYHDHREIDASLTDVGRARTTAEARNLLETALRASRDHFAYEERHVFPMLERWLHGESLNDLGGFWLRHRAMPEPAAR